MALTELFYLLDSSIHLGTDSTIYLLDGSVHLGTDSTIYLLDGSAHLGTKSTIYLLDGSVHLGTDSTIYLLDGPKHTFARIELFYQLGGSVHLSTDCAIYLLDGAVHLGTAGDACCRLLEHVNMVLDLGVHVATVRLRTEGTQCLQVQHVNTENLHCLVHLYIFSGHITF